MSEIKHKNIKAGYSHEVCNADLAPVEQ